MGAQLLLSGQEPTILLSLAEAFFLTVARDLSLQMVTGGGLIPSPRALFSPLPLKTWFEMMATDGSPAATSKSVDPKEVKWGHSVGARGKPRLWRPKEITPHLRERTFGRNCHVCCWEGRMVMRNRNILSTEKVA